MNPLLRILSSLPLVAAALWLGGSVVSSAAEENPVLKENDTILMSVFEEADLSVNTRVMRSGEVDLPLIGYVKVGGLTVSQANDVIRNLYISEEYLKDPKISLSVAEYSQDFVSVIGSVRSPGQVPLPANGQFDLAAALASAGGLAPEADPNRITITRANGDESTHSATTVQGGTVVALRPGDRVRVDQSPYVGKSVTILGQVRRTGPVAFPLNGRLDIVLAIAGAGGFTELANPKKVSINRKGKVTTLNVKEMTDKGDKSYYLLPDDIVTVAERLF